MQDHVAFAKQSDVQQLDLLTTAQVADRFRVTPSTVARWAKDGKLAVVRTPGGTLRFRPEDVEAFFATVSTEGAA